MGRKVHPYGFRLGVSRTWTAKWYADKEYTSLVKEDISIRQLVDRRLANASVSGVEIERGINHVTVTIHTAKPGIVIGKGGANVEILRQQIGAAHEAPGQAGDQGDPPAGARRPPRRDEHRPAADPPDRLQEGDEAGDPAVDEGRREGRPDRRRGPPRRLRDGSPRVGSRRSDPARDAPRRHQLRPDPRSHDVRPDRRQGLDLSRRHRPDPDRCRTRPRPQAAIGGGV